MVFNNIQNTQIELPDFINNILKIYISEKPIILPGKYGIEGTDILNLKEFKGFKFNVNDNTLYLKSALINQSICISVDIQQIKNFQELCDILSKEQKLNAIQDYEYFIGINTQSNNLLCDVSFNKNNQLELGKWIKEKNKEINIIGDYSPLTINKDLSHYKDYEFFAEMINIEDFICISDLWKD